MKPASFRSFVLAALVVAFTGGGTTAEASSTADFRMRLELTLKTALAETEITTGVPALVRLSESTISGFDYDDFSLAKGGDMMFTDAAGNELPFEVDTWDPSGESLVWVKIPSTAANTVIKMYYGNGATPSAASTSVWSDYVGVWHLNDTNATDTANSYGEYPNSTATAGIDGNLADKSFANEEGKFGKSFRVNDGGWKTGNFNYGGVWVPGTDALKLGNTFTISGWFRHRNQQFYWDHIFYKRSASSGTGGFAIEVGCQGNTANKPNVRGGDSKNAGVTFTGTHTDWNYFTFVYNGTTVTAYENGVQKGSGTIGAVTDNTSPLVFGDNINIASGNRGDAAWGGWIDECRLVDAVMDANAIAAEYAAQNGGASDIFTYGEATLLDQTAVVFDEPTLAYDGSKWTFSVAVTKGAGTANAVYEELGGNTTTTSLGNVTAGNTYTDEPILTSCSAYAFKATGNSTGGSPSEKAGSGIVYYGAVSAAKISDADEASMTPGVIRFSIPAALAKDLTFAYAVGGTAVAGETYEELSGTATIAAGDTSVDVQIVPIYSETVKSDVTVVLTVSHGSVVGGESSELTIINSEVDPYTRYISTTGDDSKSGTTLAAAKATLNSAIESLASVSADHDCTIKVAEGTYELVLSPAGASEWSVVLTNRISVIGMTGDPKDVTFVRGSTAYGLFRVNNENTKLQYLTISGGLCWGNNTASQGIQKGGGVYLQNGVVEDCVVTGSRGPAYGQCGIGIYVDGGRVSRCRITAGTSSNSSQNGTGVYVAAGLVEDSLIDANYCQDAGSVYVKSGATFLNCTVVNNTGALTSGVRVEKATAKVVNCAIFGNTSSESAHGGVYTWGYGAAYHNCATDYEIIDGDNCIVCQPRFRDAANKDYMPSAGSQLLDLGTSRSAYSAVSTTDLAGNPRENGTVDIGCYENTKTIPEVALEWSADSEVLPAVLTLRAASFGLESSEYSWTLHNNDTDLDVMESGAEVSVSDLTAGTYTISVAAGGLTYTSPYAYTLSPTDLYVAAGNENAEFPYDTVEKASATIATALAAAGDAATIHVKNGTYPITAQIKMDKAVRIVGESRNGVIVINTTQYATSRIFYVGNAKAEVSTMTLAGGYSCNAGNGGNLYFSGTGGMVSNCLITAGLVKAQYNQGSGAAYMNGGILTHCEITDCNANPSGSIECNRVISLNKKSITAPRVSNCLIHDCVCTNGGDKAKGGDLIYVGDYCLMDNCTIVDCMTFANSPIVNTHGYNNSYPNSGHTVNCVIFGEDAAGSKAKCAYGNTYNGTKWPQLYYNCVTEETITDGTYVGHDCVTAMPNDVFRDYAAKLFAPKADCALVDAGAESDYSLPFPSVDYRGRSRVSGKSIDIGCYELPAGGLILIIR